MKIKFLILMSFLFILTGCTSQSQNYDLSFYEEAQRNYSNAEYSKAIENLKKSININNTHTDSYIFAADILNEKKNFSDSIEILKLGENLVLDKDSYNTILGRTYFLNNEYENSKNAYSSSLQKNKLNSESFIGYVRSEGLLGNNEFAINYFNEHKGEHASSKEVQKLDYILNFDKAELNKEIYEKYKVDIDKLNENDTNEVVKLMINARIRINEGYPELANDIIDEIIKSNEFFEGGYLYKAIVDYYKGNFDDSTQNFKKSLELNSEIYEAYVFLASIEANKENTEESIKYFDIASKLSNNNEIRSTYYNYLKPLNNSEKRISLLNEIKLTEVDNIEISLELAEEHCLYSNDETELNQIISELNLLKIDEEYESRFKVLEACLSYRQGNSDIALKNINEVLITDKKLVLGYYIEYLIANETGNEKTEELKNRVIDSDIEGIYSKLI